MLVFFFLFSRETELKVQHVDGVQKAQREAGRLQA